MEGLGSQSQLHEYKDCSNAKTKQCGYREYWQWRAIVSFNVKGHCWSCGLSQRICPQKEAKKEERKLCEYPQIMLPSIYILHQCGQLAIVVQAVGFQGDYNSKDLWEWLRRPAEGWGLEWESNWMKTWEVICKKLVPRVEIARYN